MYNKCHDHGVGYDHFELVNIEHKSVKADQNNDLLNIALLQLLKKYSIFPEITGWKTNLLIMNLYTKYGKGNPEILCI